MNQAEYRTENLFMTTVRINVNRVGTTINRLTLCHCF